MYCWDNNCLRLYLPILLYFRPVWLHLPMLFWFGSEGVGERCDCLRDGEREVGWLSVPSESSSLSSSTGRDVSFGLVGKGGGR